MMSFVDVYSYPAAGEILYGLLAERDLDLSISHKALPEYVDHLTFVASRPYKAWYLLRADGEFVGSVYLTKADEIGVFVFRRFQGRGYGKKAVEGIKEMHPRPSYLANINPRNQRSINMFRSLGFGHIQNTYEWRA